MLTLLTAATTEPVSLAEAKAHLRTTHDADDGLITRQIVAAREHIELITGVALAAATYRYVADCFRSVDSLPLWPVSEVSSVSYLDSSRTRIVVDPAEYIVDLDRLTIAPVASWPWATSVNIEFSTAPALVPESLKSAILLRVQAEYEADPEEAEKLRDASTALAWPKRRNLGV